MSGNKALFVSAITRAEILLGIALLPDGKRRDGLAEAAEQMFDEDFAGRSLAFDDNCATEDGQIAAIALTHELPLATRNGKDFKGIEGLTVLDPWE